MLAARTRLSSIVSKRTLATVAAETPKKQPDQKFKVVVVGGGPGGLSGKIKDSSIYVKIYFSYSSFLFVAISSFFNCLQIAW